MSDNLRAGAVSRTEDASGAAAGCPQSVESAILRAFENASRTTGACFAHRTHIPYHRRPSPVPNEPNATNGRGKKPLPQTEPSANSSQMPGKRPLPQTALPEIQQTPEKRGLFPRQHHRQIPHNRNPVAAGKYLFRRRCSHAWI